MTPALPKRPFRFSLAAALAAITVCCVAVAALRGGDWFWARVVFTLALALVLAAVLGAIFRGGAARAFWGGFALFGAVYLLLAFLPMFRIAEHQLIGHEVKSLLRDYKPDGNSGLVLEAAGSRIAVFSFYQIIHCLVALVFALLGGLAGVFFHSGRDRLSPPSDSTPHRS